MKKILTLGLAAVAAVGVIGLGSLSASAVESQNRGYAMGQGQGGGKSAMLESRAQMFGMTVEELQKALETKTMSQIAVEKGYTEDTFRAKMLETAKARWEARGLSTEEIDQRIADREARHAANSADHEFGSGEGTRMGGFGRHK